MPLAQRHEVAVMAYCWHAPAEEEYHHKKKECIGGMESNETWYEQYCGGSINENERRTKPVVRIPQNQNERLVRPEETLFYVPHVRTCRKKVSVPSSRTGLPPLGTGWKSHGGRAGVWRQPAPRVYTM